VRALEVEVNQVETPFATTRYDVRAFCRTVHVLIPFAEVEPVLRVLQAVFPTRRRWRVSGMPRTRVLMPRRTTLAVMVNGLPFAARAEADVVVVVARNRVVAAAPAWFVWFTATTETVRGTVVLNPVSVALRVAEETVAVFPSERVIL
jgi:hypothetical protein